MATLVGKWDITTVNKDRVTTSSPLYEKAFKSSQCTGCIIEKTVKDDSDEISLTFETNRSTKLKLYLQPGVLNFESVKGNDISLCIVQSCSGSLDEFKVVRLGPKKGQRSCEIYKVNRNGDGMEINVVTSTNGTEQLYELNAISNLERSGHSKDIQQDLIKLADRTVQKTKGWNDFDLLALQMCKTDIIAAVALKLDSNNRKKPLFDTIWVCEKLKRRNVLDISSFIDLCDVPRHFGNRDTTKEKIVFFIMEVSIEKSSWVVAHRYNEFDVLRKFLTVQDEGNRHLAEALMFFPPKILFLPYRPTAMHNRVIGLTSFLKLCTANGETFNKISMEALASFLQIPEHVGGKYQIVDGKSAAEIYKVAQDRNTILNDSFNHSANRHSAAINIEDLYDSDGSDDIYDDNVISSAYKAHPHQQSAIINVEEVYQNDSDEDISDDNIISNSYKLDSASADRHSAPVNAEEIFSPSITNEQNIYDSNLLFSRSRSLHKSVVTNRSNSYMKPTPSRYDNLISGTNELMGRSAYTNHNESKTSLERMFDSVAVSASNDAGISSEDAVVVESDKDLGLYNESVDVEEVVVRKSSEYQVEKAEDLADVVNSENNDKTIASDSKSKEALKKELSAVNVQEERSDEMYDEIAQKPTETEVTAIVNHSTPSAAKGSIDVEESIGNTEGSTNKTTKDRSPDDITDTDGEGNDSIKDEEERHRLSIESGADVLIDTPEKVVEIPLVPSSHNDDNSGDEAEEHNEEMDRFSSPKIEMLKRTRSYESMTPKEILWAVLFEGLVVIKHGRQGAPKRRILRCDEKVQNLYWMDERRGSYSKNKPVDTSARSIALKDILEVRAGTENDPASFDAFDSTSSAVGVPPVKSKSLFSRNTSEASMTDPSLSRHTSNNDVLSQDQNNVAAKRVSLKKRRSSFFSRSDDTNEAARGTAVLRRNCKAGDLELSFSLILPNRTFDIQCLNKPEFDALYYSFLALVSNK